MNQDLTDHAVAQPAPAQGGKPATYFVHTYGCQMNEHDSQAIAGLLEADGYVASDDPEAADLIVYNTCTIRENADNRLYGNLGHAKDLKARRPELKIVVAGCQAQKDRGMIQTRAPHVDVVMGTHNVHRVAELVREAHLNGPLMEILEEAEKFPSALPMRRDEPWSAWLSIQIGCDNSCAFCIVPSVRGKEISRPFGELVREAEALAAAGTVEVTLLGQNVNSYGRDLTMAWRDRHPNAIDACGTQWALADTPRSRPLFADLLHSVGTVEGIRRVRFTSPHPKDLRPETIEAMATVPTVMPHLHLPLQSGSDRILTAMRRGYTTDRYLERLSDARSAIEGLAVTTDIIVGFPGETEADFEQTMQLVADVGYDSAFLFVFSPRPGTAAFEMADQFVPAEVINDRFERLNTVLERSALACNQRRIGMIESVLALGASKRLPEVTSGRTEHNKLIHFQAFGPDGAPKVLPAGTFVDVRVLSAAPHFLRGEQVAITAAPRHRTRIPVNAA